MKDGLASLLHSLSLLIEAKIWKPPIIYRDFSKPAENKAKIKLSKHCALTILTENFSLVH